MPNPFSNFSEEMPLFSDYVIEFLNNDIVGSMSVGLVSVNSSDYTKAFSPKPVVPASLNSHITIPAVDVPKVKKGVKLKKVITKLAIGGVFLAAGAAGVVFLKNNSFIKNQSLKLIKKVH